MVQTWRPWETDGRPLANADVNRSAYPSPVPRSSHESQGPFANKLPGVSSFIEGPQQDENAVPAETKGKAASCPTAGSRGPGANTVKTAPKKASTSASASSSKKRKSDAVEDQEDLPEIDDNDPRLYTTESCNQIRRKIRNTIESGAMKVGEFQKAIGCSSASYQRFMKQNGPKAGIESDLYILAARFFKKRELQGLKAVPPAPKKARKSTGSGDNKGEKGEKGGKSFSSSLDVSGIHLPGEETQSVPVLEMCDEIRKKIRAFLRRGDVTQAAFCREIAKSFPQERKVQSKQLNDFLGKSGPLAGNTSCVYYGSYVFFEKLRLKEGKPKSQMRLETESAHPSGVNTTDVMNWFFCRNDQRPVLDKLGNVYTVPAGGRLRAS